MNYVGQNSVPYCQIQSDMDAKPYDGPSINIMYSTLEMELQCEQTYVIYLKILNCGLPSWEGIPF